MAENDDFWGLFGAESVAVRVPVTVPAPPALPGVSVTVIEQFAPAANVEPQVLLPRLKGSLNTTMLVMLMLVDP